MISPLVWLENLQLKVRFFFRKDREPYFFLYQLLGFCPRDIHFYRVALLHRSLSLTDASGDKLNNERLEFLGDSILGSIVTVYLYRHYRHANEGFLTVARARIVCRKSLNEVGRKLGLHERVKNSINVSTHNNYLCGNALEALIGAIYLDRGYRVCQQFVENRILKQCMDLDKLVEQGENFKSRLLEWAQGRHIAVDFRLVEETRDEQSNPVFYSEVYIAGRFCARGKGYTKKESHQLAAREALSLLESDAAFAESLLCAAREEVSAVAPDGAAAEGGA